MMKQLHYVRARAVNAWWMLRNGELRQMIDAVFEEIGHRSDDLRRWWVTVKPKKLVRVPHSAYEDPSRVFPPSHRPTRLRLPGELAARADMRAVGTELAVIRRGLFLKQSDAP